MQLQSQGCNTKYTIWRSSLEWTPSLDLKSHKSWTQAIKFETTFIKPLLYLDYFLLWITCSFFIVIDTCFVLWLFSCLNYDLFFFIAIDTCFVLWLFSSFNNLVFLHCNWHLWRKISTVPYSEIWLNRVIVHWLFLFNNLILYWVMFELLLFL